MMLVKKFDPIQNGTYKKSAQFAYAINEEICYSDRTFAKFLARNPNIMDDFEIPETGYFQVKNTDYSTGDTVLHITLVGTARRHMKSLIKQHGGVTKMNANFSTVLHVSIERLYDNYFEYWKDEVSDHKVEGPFDTANSLLSAHLTFKNTANPYDKNGITHFHIACMVNNLEVVTFFLEKRREIVHEPVLSETEIVPGFTPLHFAAKYCATEVHEKLFECGANIHVKDAKGMTSLHILIDEKLKLFIQMRKALCKAFRPFESNHPSFVLFLFKNEQLILSSLRKYSIDSCNKGELNSFHAICTMSDTSLVIDHLKDVRPENIDNFIAKTDVWCSGYTALHFASHFNPKTVQLLLQSGADIRNKTAKGLSAFDICLQNFKLEDIYNIIMLEPILNNIIFSDNKTKLSTLISAMMKPETFANFLKRYVEKMNIFIPSTSEICPGNTPLHFAVTCTEIPTIHWDPDYTDCPRIAYLPNSYTAETKEYLERIKACLDHGADPTKMNDNNFTPLQLAFRSESNNAVIMLLKYHVKNINPTDVDGLSHLHIASAAENNKMVEKLLMNRANVNSTTVSCFTYRPYYIAKGSTPLHFAAIVKCYEVIRTLITYGADVLALDEDKATPLERFYEIRSFSEIKDVKRYINKYYSNEDKEIMRVLIVRAAVQIIEDKQNPEYLMQCFRMLSDELLRSILKVKNKSQQKIFSRFGITKLHVACLFGDCKKVKKHLRRTFSNVNLQVKKNSSFWTGFTPLHVAIKANNFDTVKLLLKYGADVTLQNAEHDSPLHATFNRIHGIYGYEYNICIFDALLRSQKNFKVNPTDVGGISHFHFACARGDTSIIEAFYKSGARIDQVTDYYNEPFNGFTGLHFAVYYWHTSAVELLIKYGANVRCKTTINNNLLHTCFAQSLSSHVRLQREGKRRREIFKILIDAGLNVNERNIFGETPLLYLVKKFNFMLAEIGNYLNHNCSVNVCDIDGEGLMAVLFKYNDNVAVYKKFTELIDINDIDESGRNIIHNVVSHRQDWVINPMTDGIAWVMKYTAIIGHLIRLGLDIHHQDQNLLTPLHVASQLQNVTGIVGLLENGADINLVDNSNSTALQLATDEQSVVILRNAIVAVFADHVCKLDYFKLYVNEYYRTALEDIIEQRSLELRFDEKCRVELPLLEKHKIHPYNLTLRKFLSETGAVAGYPNMHVDKRYAIDEFFKTNDLHAEYPTLACLLYLQYRKALMRVQLVNVSEYTLISVARSVFPVICSRVIFRFLTNKDLENLIACMN